MRACTTIDYFCLGYNQKMHKEKFFEFEKKNPEIQKKTWKTTNDWNLETGYKMVNYFLVRASATEGEFVWDIIKRCAKASSYSYQTS